MFHKLGCSTPLLAAADCSPLDIQTCLCGNNTMQSELFVCVMASCNHTEQMGSSRLLPEKSSYQILVSAKVSQTLLCSGVPQPSRRKEITRVISIITGVTFPFIFLRGISRYLVTKFWWDDWVVCMHLSIAFWFLVKETSGRSYISGLLRRRIIPDRPPRSKFIFRLSKANPRNL